MGTAHTGGRRIISDMFAVFDLDGFSMRLMSSEARSYVI